MRKTMRFLTRSTGTIGMVLLAITVAACGGLTEIDNYDAPNSMLSGHVMYNGSPVSLRTGGVQLELWEPAYENRDKIPIYVNQDGSFSALVFDGDYRLNTIDNNGPWVNRTDTIDVHVRGNTVVDVAVQPYYVVQDPQITYDSSDGPEGSVTASFRIANPNPGRDLEYVGLYVGTTAFVDRINRVAQLEVPRAQLPANWMTDPVTLNVKLPDNIRVTPSPAPREHVHVRVGIKVVGLAEMIFSPLVKLSI